MSTIKETIWKMEPHTAAKHEILRRYLGAWFPILGRYNDVLYIDGFAGPGRYKNGEDGSPILVLKIALKYQNLKNTTMFFRFTENDKNRFEHLQQELSKFSGIPSNFDVGAEHKPFDIFLTQYLDKLEKSGVQHPATFAFIDPFGFKGIPFDLVARLLEKPKTEVFINLMAEHINRFIDHPDEKIPEHIVKVFGTKEIQQIPKKATNRFNEIRLLYQKQLKKHAQFVRFFEMQGKHHNVIYYLFFATKDSLGHEKMKEAFWSVDSESGFKFSDATNPNQYLLFQHDETPKLAQIILNHFKSQKATVDKVSQFVLDETIYLKTHLKQALKLLEKDAKIQVYSTKQDGKKRRKGSFPDETIILFEPPMRQLSLL